MEQNGFITLHRKLLQSSVFDDAELLKVWVWCLLRANHKDTEVVHSKQIIKLKRGQFITGRFKASEELRLSPMKFRQRLQLLGGLGQISIKSTNKYSIITVIKYGDYQDKGKKLTNKQPTNNQQTTTDNNVNNVNNIGDESPTTMAWKKYDERNHSDDEVVIDADSGEEVVDNSAKEANEKVTSLIEWAEKIRGKKFIDIPTQRKMIHEMRKAKFSPDVIKNSFVELVHSDYWQKQERLPDFKTVLSDLKNKK